MDRSFVRPLFGLGCGVFVLLALVPAGLGAAVEEQFQSRIGISRDRGGVPPSPLPEGTWDSSFGPAPGTDGGVYCAVSAGRNLYIGGTFNRVGTTVARNIARWDGARWHPVGDGVDGEVYALAVKDGQVLAGGHFTIGLVATNLARWTGTRWTALGRGYPRDAGDGLFGFVFAILIRGDKVLIGGQFNFVGDVAATNIARWDGGRWSGVGGGIGDHSDEPPYQGVPEFPGGRVNALAVFNERIYAGGRFTKAGGVVATNLACWDGRVWRNVGDMVSDQDPSLNWGTVSAMTANQAGLFVGGVFRQAGSLRVTNLARWTGTAWKDVGGGVRAVNDGSPSRDQGGVSVLRVRDGRLFVGGFFNRAGTNEAENFARWDGRRWHPLEGGMPGSVQGAAFHGQNVVAVGGFGLAGRTLAANLARWDGATGRWKSIGPAPGTNYGNALNGDLYAVATDGSNCYAGGFLTSAGTNRVSGIARWDGVRWSDLDGGIRGKIGFVQHIAVSGSNVFIAGYFEMPWIGATNFAIWNGRQWSGIAGGFTGLDEQGGEHSGVVGTMAAVQGRLYLGGRFDQVGGVAATNLAVWDGTHWAALGSGLQFQAMPGYIDKLAATETHLYVAGGFDRAGPLEITNLAQWDGAVWAPVGNDPGFAAELGFGSGGIAASGTNLFIAGVDFQTQLLRIARWDGVHWTTLHQGPPGDTHRFPLTATTGSLYAGVPYGGMGTTVARGIARWNGTKWTDMAYGLSAWAGYGSAASLAANGRLVCVGGQFDQAGAVPASGFCIWREAVVGE